MPRALIESLETLVSWRLGGSLSSQSADRGCRKFQMRLPWSRTLGSRAPPPFGIGFPAASNTLLRTAERPPDVEATAPAAALRGLCPARRLPGPAAGDCHRAGAVRRCAVVDRG